MVIEHGLELFFLDGPFLGTSFEHVIGCSAEDGETGDGIGPPQAEAILMERNVEAPVEVVLNGPMLADGGEERLGVGGEGGDVEGCFDGECPLCRTAARALRVREAVGWLHLINARDSADHPVMQEIKACGLPRSRWSLARTHESIQPRFS